MPSPFRMDACGECCNTVEPCNKCATGTTPAQIRVEISGVVNGSCSTCDFMNGTFYCVQNTLNRCYYDYYLPTPLSQCQTTIGSFYYYYDRLRVALISSLISVRWGHTDSYSFVTWQKDVTSPYDCQFDGLVIPYDPYSPAGVCDISGSTCTIYVE